MMPVALALFGFVFAVMMFVVGLQFEPLMHRHKWVQVSKADVSYQGKYVSTDFICRCESCGKMRKWRL